MTTGSSRRPEGTGRPGAEPTTARGALDLRRRLALAATAVFCVGTVLCAVWAGHPDEAGTPSATALWALLAALAAVNARVVHRRRSREPGRSAVR